jgi:predicted Zn-dependent protease
LIDQRPGYEAIAEDGRGNLNHLITLVANGDRIYMVISAGPKGHAKSEDAVRFRDSFRLLGGPPPSPSADSSSE